MNAVPTWPVQMIATATLVSDKVKPSCAACEASDRSSRSTTAEMFLSEAPWAMATTLTLA